MLFVISFFVELLILFFLSRQLNLYLSFSLYHLTKNKKIVIYLMALLFFPGTLIHELAHALFAALLLVPIRGMSLLPHIQGNRVRLGSVEILKCDPIRRLIIGIAPFLFGTALLLLSLFFLTADHIFSHPLSLFFAGLVAFEIGNTMFASEKDMEGARELIISFIILGIFLYLLGFHPDSSSLQSALTNPLVVTLVSHGSLLLLIPLVLDSLLILLFKLMRR